MREKYVAISARKIFSHIFHSFSLLSLFLFVCDKYCHFVSLTWCFCFNNTFILSKFDEFRSTNICCLGLCSLFCMCLCFLKITVLLHVLPSDSG
jgi:hypothetical protein